MIAEMEKPVTGERIILPAMLTVSVGIDLLLREEDTAPYEGQCRARDALKLLYEAHGLIAAAGRILRGE